MLLLATAVRCSQVDGTLRFSKIEHSFGYISFLLLFFVDYLCRCCHYQPYWMLNPFVTAYFCCMHTAASFQAPAPRLYNRSQWIQLVIAQCVQRWRVTCNSMCRMHITFCEQVYLLYLKEWFFHALNFREFVDKSGIFIDHWLTVAQNCVVHQRLDRPISRNERWWSSW